MKIGPKSRKLTARDRLCQELQMKAPDKKMLLYYIITHDILRFVIVAGVMSVDRVYFIYMRA